MSIKIGVTGRVVPSNDAPALAAAVRQLLADPLLRARMGAAGRQRAQTEFSIDVDARPHA